MKYFQTVIIYDTDIQYAAIHWFSLQNPPWNEIYRIYWQDISHKVKNQYNPIYKYNPIYNNRIYDTIEVVIHVLVVGPPDGKYNAMADCDGQHQKARYPIIPNIFTTTLYSRW